MQVIQNSRRQGKSFAFEILWILNKQQEANKLRLDYAFAQSDLERESLIEDQEKLIAVLTKRLKGKVTLYMMKKIIDEIIVERLNNEEEM